MLHPKERQAACPIPGPAFQRGTDPLWKLPLGFWGQWVDKHQQRNPAEDRHPQARGAPQPSQQGGHAAWFSLFPAVAW